MQTQLHAGEPLTDSKQAPFQTDAQPQGPDAKSGEFFKTRSNLLTPEEEFSEIRSNLLTPEGEFSEIRSNLLTTTPTTL